MSGKQERAVGTLMLLGFAILCVWMADLWLIVFAVALSALGVLALFLYQLKVKGMVWFVLLKVPLNLFFNLFLVSLLLQSWTLREFREDLDQLDPRFE